MQRFAGKASLIALAASAPLLGGCGSMSMSDYTMPSINIPRGDIFNTGALSFSGRHEDFALPAPGPSELVSAEGQCGAASGGSTEGAGIALQMSECDVVRRAGTPEKIDTPANRYERTIVLTYTRGPRPGIYTFVGGRLVSIDRPPEAPAPQRPAKKSGRA